MGGTREWVGVDDVQTRIQMATVLLGICTASGHTGRAGPAR